jgi:hypothetical protein
MLTEEDVIDAESTSISITEDAEYQLLLSRLSQEFPPVSRQGFDFSRIAGNFAGRTAKAIVLHLSCTGWSIAEIAEAIDVPTRVVSRYLSEVIREASPIGDVEILREFELRKLDALERLCHEQFTRSCEDAVIETEGSTDKGGFSSTTKKGQSGNPAYMRAIVDIGKRRDKLLGLEKPQQIQVDKTERKMVVNISRVNSREEIEQAKVAGVLK